MNRVFSKAFALSLIMVTLCGAVMAADEEGNGSVVRESGVEGSMMRIKRSDDYKKVKVQKRDRSTYGFYAFGGMTFSTFVGQEVYDWSEDVGYIPGYTVGGGFDILRRPNGIYFGTEVAFTMKGVSKSYIDKPIFGESAVSSNVVLHYLQFTPLKVGGRIKINDNMGVSLYTGFGMDFLLGGREYYDRNNSDYNNQLMRNHSDWEGKMDMFVPFNVNLDYKKWSFGVSYDLGVKDIIEGQRNQTIHRIHNSSIAVKAIYHFRFKDRVEREKKIKEKKVVDKYHRDEF